MPATEQESSAGKHMPLTEKMAPSPAIFQNRYTNWIAGTFPNQQKCTQADFRKIGIEVQPYIICSPHNV
jgi:hypothetical protein